MYICMLAITCCNRLANVCDIFVFFNETISCKYVNFIPEFIDIYKY